MRIDECIRGFHSEDEVVLPPEVQQFWSGRSFASSNLHSFLTNKKSCLLAKIPTFPGQLGGSVICGVTLVHQRVKAAIEDQYVVKISFAKTGLSLVDPTNTRVPGSRLAHNSRGYLS